MTKSVTHVNREAKAGSSRQFSEQLDVPEPEPRTSRFTAGRDD
jgi:hypothetical protein